MVTGEYSYVLDSKGRVAIPVKFRAELSNVIYVSKGVGKSLFVHSEERWRMIESNLSSLPLSSAIHLQRKVFASAARFELDGQGRILLPPALRAHAELEKNVVILGIGNRAEIWDEALWRQYEEDELSQENMLEAMDGLGF